ncbi:MAG: class I SAM-dependent methyltransferase [Candidatus Omnitrophota bacterium]
MNDNIEYTPCLLCGSDRYDKINDFIFDGSVLSLVECKKCRLSYVNPRLTPRRMRNFFQTYTRLSDDKIEYYRLNKLNNVLYDIRLLNKITGHGSILDVGFGYGLFLERIRSIKWKAFGIEISDDACRYAIEKLKLPVVKADFTSLPFKENTFDIVTLYDSLYYNHNPKELLRQIGDKLKSGGIIVVRVHNRIWHVKFWKFLLKNIDKNPFFIKDHICQFSSRTIKLMLEDCGYKILSARNSRIPFFKGKYVSYFVLNVMLCFFDIARFLSGGRILLGLSITIIARKDH